MTERRDEQAPVREAARADAFEAGNMRDGAGVVHRDKKVSRAMAALLALPGVFTAALAWFIAVANSTSSKPLSAAALPFVVAAMVAMGLGFVVLGLVFAVVRTVVTAEAVHVKYGLWGPRIPLTQIRSCTVVDYNWTEFGGWGIRRGRDGTWAYVPGGGRVLEVRYQEAGVDKRVLIGAADPDEAARQINAARRVRVAPGADAAPLARAAEGDPAGEDVVREVDRARSTR